MKSYRSFLYSGVFSLVSVISLSAASAQTASGLRVAPAPTQYGVVVGAAPRAERGFAARGGGETAGGHGLDEMDDLILKRCNEAGGGMVTNPDGTIRCIDPEGNEIDY